MLLHIFDIVTDNMLIYISNIPIFWRLIIAYFTYYPNLEIIIAAFSEDRESDAFMIFDEKNKNRLSDWIKEKQLALERGEEYDHAIELKWPLNDFFPKLEDNDNKQVAIDISKKIFGVNIWLNPNDKKFNDNVKSIYVFYENIP